MIELTRWERWFLLRLLPLLVCVLMVVATGLAVLVQRNDDNIDSLGGSVSSVKTSTERVERFVEDLETVTPEEEDRNAAVTRAIEQVPAIRDILCEQFPEATACQAG